MTGPISTVTTQPQPNAQPQPQPMHWTPAANPQPPPPGYGAPIAVQAYSGQVHEYPQASGQMYGTNAASLPSDNTQVHQYPQGANVSLMAPQAGPSTHGPQGQSVGLGAPQGQGAVAPGVDGVPPPTIYAPAPIY